ncbi:A/G-specific adenine glycosylase [Parvularcula sp. ZS-1/3]|uniref:Adenine DNA glycosylase n=1 Tax=Parvularcula mediterranea TaxID=2732508 RepID=A0A7Y3W4D7_9PROT|nr:A/G-specific adenine glycosylase [Parvularcula mediterranea]NNU15126.1 A/G-specific adenine glycosylase [Parvularcula mediterranea]
MARDKQQAEEFGEVLLAWYDRHARELPWRVPPGEARRADPYHVLLSEVMLQQTTVAVIRKRFGEFLERFPTVSALADAEEGAVTDAWAGLGYYRRARSLHACAKAIMEEHGGVFPQTEDKLRGLPGVGDYTAAAIASIAFGEPAVVVDGNIERIVARVALVTDELPKGKKAIKAAAAELMPESRPGDYAQALMDLGAGVCRPKGPDCLLCPVRSFCKAAGTAYAESLPRKAPKREKKVVKGAIFVFSNEAGEVLCVRRPEEGLFAGMLGLPGGGWDGSDAPPTEGFKLKGGITHILTHRRLEIDVYSGPAPGGTKGAWLSADEARESLPTLFKKALDRGLS